jgi:membrane protease YdiL (CAAX protease family)
MHRPLERAIVFFLLLVVTVTSMTFTISWLRLKSGSVWPAILLHASHNLYIQRLFDPLPTETSSLSKYVIGESGIALTIVFLALAVVFWGFRKRLRYCQKFYDEYERLPNVKFPLIACLSGLRLS